MIQIAIDGPAGAGKSSLAKALAKRMGYLYIDTGALYRSLALGVLRAGADPKNEEEVIPLLGGLQVTLGFENGEQQVFLNGENVSGLIRTPEVSMGASQVSAHPPVRSFLFDLQRNIAEANNVLMDGRDIGTVVLPNAQVKIFLTATPEERARRRVAQLEASGQSCDFAQVLAEVIQRDEQDSTRAIAPLRQAEDAVLVDTTGETVEESLDRMERIIREKLGA